MSVVDRFKNAWNAFTQNKDPTFQWPVDIGPGYSFRPDRPRLTQGNERSIVSSVINRMAIDASSIDILHVRLDSEQRYVETIYSDLNNCLNKSANIDQTGRAFRQDIFQSLLDEGAIAIVPVDTNINPITGAFKIYTLRVGKIVDWYPSYVKVRLYDEKEGREKDILVSKGNTAIVENPFYSVMNEPNSTAKRLMRKLALIDAVDEQSGAGKLDMIIQLPYVIKTPAREAQAKERKRSIEEQLTNSKYGIAYTDATEKITQLNRPVDNQLLQQAETLKNTLYSQLGITEEIMNGTANEDVLNNYHSRTIEPIISAVTDEMERKFLTQTAITQGQAIKFYRDPFKLISASKIADISDKYTRNEIMSSNEVRQKVGLKPSNQPGADELRNKNMPAPESGIEPQFNTQMDDIDAQLDELDDMAQSDLEDVDFIMHYASPYYDPVKAHEYYMKNRELVGKRTSTSDLNEEGQSAASYIREQINAERDQKLTEQNSKYQESLDKTYSSRDNDINEHAERMTSEIDKLRRKLAKMSSAERALRSNQIKKEIASLREEHADFKFGRSIDASEEVTNISNENSRVVNEIQERYANLYLSELDKMHDNGDWVKQGASKVTSKVSRTQAETKETSATDPKSRARIEAARDRYKKKNNL